jgi:hypothetical protein
MLMYHANNISAPLQDVPYVDFPELKFNEHESTQMPFRYVKADDGMPIMPKVSIFLSQISRYHNTDYLGNGGLDQERCRQGHRRPFLIWPPTSGGLAYMDMSFGSHRASELVCLQLHVLYTGT